MILALVIGEEMGITDLGNSEYVISRSPLVLRLDQHVKRRSDTAHTCPRKPAELLPSGNRPKHARADESMIRRQQRASFGVWALLS